MLEYNLGEGYRLTYKQKLNGFSGYCDVDFRSYDRDKLIRRFTDENGVFLDFSGVEPSEWEKDLEKPFEPVTRFVNCNPFREDGLAEFILGS